MNPRNHEVARMVVDVPSGDSDGGDCGGRGRDRGGSATTVRRVQYCSLWGRVWHARESLLGPSCLAATCWI